MAFIQQNYSELIPDLVNFKQDDCGLFEGKAGRAILLYLISRYNQQDGLKDNALTLLDEISDEIANIDYLGFANGLAGIGWAVEWTAQNGFLEINTDEILDDIDNTLYKSVVYSPDKDISLASGTLGKMCFFLSRYKSNNLHTHRLKRICHEECLILLTDDLYEKVLGEEGLIKNEYLANDDLINLGHLIYFISDFLRLKVNEVTVEKLLNRTLQFVDHLIEGYCNNRTTSERDIMVQFLSICYYFAGKNHKHNFWQQRALNLLKIILPSYSEVDNSRLSDLTILNSLLHSPIISGNNNGLSISVEDKNITFANSKGKSIICGLYEHAIQDNMPWINLLLMF